MQRGAGSFNWTNYYHNIYPADSPGNANALVRDTFTLIPYSWTLVRFVADNPGLWAFHCHIAWHMEAGLLMQFMSRAPVLGTSTVPQDVKDLCGASVS